MSLSMRVPSVVPRYAVAVGSLKQSAEGNGDRENTLRKGGIALIVFFVVLLFLTFVNL